MFNFISDLRDANENRNGIIFHQLDWNRPNQLSLTKWQVFGGIQNQCKLPQFLMAVWFYQDTKYLSYNNIKYMYLRLSSHISRDVSMMTRDSVKRLPTAILVIIFKFCLSHWYQQDNGLTTTCTTAVGEAKKPLEKEEAWHSGCIW